MNVKQIPEGRNLSAVKTNANLKLDFSNLRKEFPYNIFYGKTPAAFPKPIVVPETKHKNIELNKSDSI